MSERLEAIKRWLSAPGRSKVTVSLDEEASKSLQDLASGRTEPEVLSFMASHLLEDVLRLGDWEKVIEHASRPRVGDEAPDVEVFDAQGAGVKLSSTWEDGAVALIFLRHYG